MVVLSNLKARKINIMRRIVPVILCGGSGTRLWPLSRKNTPKQFLKLLDEYTLLQRTVIRTLGILGNNPVDVVTVTLQGMHEETVRQLTEISPHLSAHILLEPEGRNTAAAVAFAVQYIEQNIDPEALIWILPADHYIGDEKALGDAVYKAAKAAEKSHLVTFGIEPTRPETGYGYIRKARNINGSGSYHVEKFFEKPKHDIALQFVQSGEYLWSSGMHLFTAETAKNNFLHHAPDTWKRVELALLGTNNMRTPLRKFYGKIKKEPFETAVLEKSANVAVVPCDPKWTDVGCWESVWEMKAKDRQGNALDGNAVAHDAKNCMIMAQDRLITCVGLEDVIVIDTGDSVLVAHKNNTDALKAMVQNLEATVPEEIPARPMLLKKPGIHLAA
jgi:mannose-1-phosphate guanylyltransferase/mannose-6-phosphate isomerase